MEQRSIQIEFPSTSGTTTEERYAAWPHKGIWRIDEVKFVPATAVALDGTNTITSTITTNDGAAGSDRALASHHTNTTGGTALVLKTTLDLSLSAAGRELREGYGIKVAKTAAGTGGVLDGTYTITATKIG